MKRINLKSVIGLFLFLLISCNETVVTNIVHPDGSVTRRIEIKDMDGKNFDPENYRVPFDSTWTITDTFEVGEKSDTTWIRRAEKLFKNVEEINDGYKNDIGTNRNYAREARFSKKFKWFNTIYTFSEYIGSCYSYGYPVEQYLTKKELEYFYLPDNILQERLEGPDSLVIRQIVDSVDIKTDKWLLMCNISEWREEFAKLAEKNIQWDANKEQLQNKDSMILNYIEVSMKDTTESDMDTTLTKTFKEVFGDGLYQIFRIEFDSSLKIIEERFATASAFDGYSVRTLMPGKLVSTNGFIDKDGEILWPVDMEYFLAQPYDMWAQSKNSNKWAWVVSGVFLGFVALGLIIRLFRK
jgi:hypothetical protein